MRPLALLLLASCASAPPQAWVREEPDGRWFHEVSFADRTLSLDRHHRAIWRDYTRPGRVCRGISEPQLGQDVLVRTGWETIRARVVGLDPTMIYLASKSWQGMSGAGAWLPDDTIIGAVQGCDWRDAKWVRLALPESEVVR